jgi:transcription antitermination factor NusG
MEFKYKVLDRVKIIKGVFRNQNGTIIDGYKEVKGFINQKEKFIYNVEFDEKDILERTTGWFSENELELI